MGHHGHDTVHAIFPVALDWSKNHNTDESEEYSLIFQFYTCTFTFSVV